MQIDYSFMTGVAAGLAISFIVFLVGYFLALLEFKIERIKYTNSRPRRFR